MSDLNRCINPHRECEPAYRVVSDTPRGTTHEYADDLDVAQSMAETIGGRIECYVYGYGWVRWCEAMAGKKVIE